jgi:ABC-2 type transport system ATP-binding protein
MNAIEVVNLSKSYNKDNLALKDITFDVPTGSIFGFLGPNGAGKTTLVRTLNGILYPTQGSGKILGKDIINDRKEIRTLCGVMTESAGIYENLTCMENLNFFGKMFGLNNDDINKRSLYLLNEFKLLDVKDKKVKTFSTGMKKRLSLIRTLLHSPKILFLDEPTSGLDPESSKIVLDFIKKIALEEDVTVFLCTHQLKYAEEICNLYGFINKGNLIGYGTFNELLYNKNQNIKLEIKGSNLPNIDNMKKIKENRYLISIDSEESIPNILKQIFNEGGKIYEAKQIYWDLEDLYFAYQRGDNNE